MNLLLVAGAVVALSLAGVAIQTKRLEMSQAEAQAHEISAKLATARIETLAAEKQAAESALGERDAAHDEIRRLRASTSRKFKEAARVPEIAASLDCPVPDGIRSVLRDRRGSGQPAAAEAPGQPAPGMSAPGGRPGDARRNG